MQFTVSYTPAGMFLCHYNMSDSNVVFKNLGLQEYTSVWESMKEFTAQRNSTSLDEIWFVQHPAVYTLGLNGKKAHLLTPTDIPVINIDRGGQVTFHAPGQLVAYCMINLKRRHYGVHEFVSRLQKSIQSLLLEYNINSHLVDGAPGVYVKNRKIAALGLRVKHNCTYHGLSINVDMDLTPFSDINPCGYSGLQVSQLSDYGISETIENVIDRLQPILENNIYSPHNVS